MTATRTQKSPTPDPIQVGIQMWEAGSQFLSGNWHQSQELWNSMAHGWGEVTGIWLGQFAHFNEAIEALRRPQEAASAVMQAGVRLPFALIGCAQAGELQHALIRLIHAQDRASQVWLEAFSPNNVEAASSESKKPTASEKRLSRSPRRQGPRGQTRKRKHNFPSALIYGSWFGGLSGNADNTRIDRGYHRCDQWHRP